MVWDGSPAMSSPLNTIRPLVGRSTPVRQLKKVDFPAPLGPMIARISPAGTPRDTLLRAASPPKRTVSPSVLRIGGWAVRGDTRATEARSAPGGPGRSERRGGWGARSGPPLSLGGPSRGPPCPLGDLRAGAEAVLVVGH